MYNEKGSRMRLEPWRIATCQRGKEAETRKETTKDSKDRSVLEAEERSFPREWICWYQYLWKLQKPKIHHISI